MTNRRDFLKKACIGGACLCGLGSFVPCKALNVIGNQEEENTEERKNDSMLITWITQLLDNIDKNLDEQQTRAIVKSAFVADFQNIGMDKVLKPYIGDVDAFIQFLEKEWGWIITRESPKVIIADENKPACVCRILQNAKKPYPALCYCSEEFAEQMFSVVTGKPANAVVISSIQWGDKSCVYRIVLS